MAEDVELVKRGSEAFETGDMAWMNDHMADDCLADETSAGDVLIDKLLGWRGVDPSARRQPAGTWRDRKSRITRCWRMASPTSFVRWPVR